MPENKTTNQSVGNLLKICRTKLDGYKPPAYWERIPRIREKVNPTELR
jgi:hypothetical protein